MTVEELIEQLRAFDPNDRVQAKIITDDKHQESVFGTVDRVITNIGSKDRVLIVAFEQ